MAQHGSRRRERSQDEITVFRPALATRTLSTRITRRAARAGYGLCTGACTCLCSLRIRSAPLRRYAGAPTGAIVRPAPSPSEEGRAEFLPRQSRRL